MSSVYERLQGVRARIKAAAAAAGRDAAGIRLVAVSKTFAAEAVAQAVRAGQFAFGENYAQEGAEKKTRVAALVAADRMPPLEWHFIGPIQSNKTRLIAETFDWVHSVDRAKVAERLNAARPPSSAPLQVCLQVNVSGEASKSGVEPETAADLARTLRALPRLRLRGLMAIPRPTPDYREQCASFRALRELRDRLAAGGVILDTLSMGMSEDLEAAVAEGATMVRVGRAIFGERAARA